MMTWPQIIAVGFVICAAIMAALAWTAPFGWEDEDGYHEGVPEGFDPRELTLNEREDHR